MTRSKVMILPMKMPIFGGLSTEWAKRNICVSPVGTEEIAHWEMIGTMIHQCLRDATLKDIEAAGLMGYYTMHSKGVYPADPNGVPFTAAYLQCTGDPIADITEDMAADAAMSKRQHFAQKRSTAPHGSAPFSAVLIK